MSKTLIFLLLYSALGLFWLVRIFKDREITLAWLDFLGFFFFLLAAPVFVGLIPAYRNVGWVVLVVMFVELVIQLWSLMAKEKFYFLKTRESLLQADGYDGVALLTYKFLHEEGLEPAAIHFRRNGFFSLRGLNAEQEERYLDLLNEELVEEHQKLIQVWRYLLMIICLYAMIRPLITYWLWH